VAGFMISGILNAANTEAANVKTAAVGYLGENGAWPEDSSELGDFLDGPIIRGTYTFGGSAGISSATPGSWGSDISWNDTTQQWERGEAAGLVLPVPIHCHSDNQHHKSSLNLSQAI